MSAFVPLKTYSPSVLQDDKFTLNVVHGKQMLGLSPKDGSQHPPTLKKIHFNVTLELLKKLTTLKFIDWKTKEFEDLFFDTNDWKVAKSMNLWVKKRVFSCGFSKQIIKLCKQLQDGRELSYERIPDLNEWISTQTQLPEDKKKSLLELRSMLNKGKEIAKIKVKRIFWKFSMNKTEPIFTHKLSIDFVDAGQNSYIVGSFTGEYIQQALECEQISLDYAPSKVIRHIQVSDPKFFQQLQKQQFVPFFTKPIEKPDFFVERFVRGSFLFSKSKDEDKAQDLIYSLKQLSPDHPLYDAMVYYIRVWLFRNSVTYSAEELMTVLSAFVSELQSRVPRETFSGLFYPIEYEQMINNPPVSLTFSPNNWILLAFAVEHGSSVAAANALQKLIESLAHYLFYSDEEYTELTNDEQELYNYFNYLGNVVATSKTNPPTSYWGNIAKKMDEEIHEGRLDVDKLKKLIRKYPYYPIVYRKLCVVDLKNAEQWMSKAIECGWQRPGIQDVAVSVEGLLWVLESVLSE